MNRIGYLFTSCIILYLLVACAKEFKINSHLLTAMQTVDENPREALRLLEEVPYPHTMDQENYMRYIVTLAQARYMDYQDITGDTLILEAQRFFVEKQSPEMAARASYYAAAYWHEKGDEPKSLEYALLSHYFAQLAGNSLFQAKSTQWIGSSYYDQELLDNAWSYYQQALEIYEKVDDSKKNQLEIKYTLGRISLEKQQLEQALNYFDNGLEEAIQMNDKFLEVRFLHYKGIVFEKKNAYSQAQEYFDLALSKQSLPEDSLRIYLSYAQLYRTMGRLDSIKHYLSLVKNRVNELSYPYNRRTAYNELALYYENEGNIPELKRYLKLANEEDFKIKVLQKEEKLQLANQRFESYKQKTEQKYNRRWKIGIGVVLALLFLLIVYKIDTRKLKTQFKRLYQRQRTQTANLEEFLIGGLQQLADNVDELRKKKLIFTDPVIWEQFEQHRDRFSVQIADLTKRMFERAPNGDRILSKLTSEDLCIIHLVRKNYSDEKIRKLMGYEYNADCYVEFRISHIWNVLTAIGLKEREIKRVFQQN